MNQSDIAGRVFTGLQDFKSGVVVFLVALPLCLGIALASGAPLFSGLLSGIIGGIVVGLLSGSHTSVSGPAAGLTAIVAAQISALGSFEAFLFAVLLAGVIQVAMGIAQAGGLANFVPSSVISGLLAAIGVILILKQIPHLLGHDTDPEGEMSFTQPDHENTFSELLTLFEGEVHSGAIVIGVLSVAILLIWNRVNWLKQLIVPAPLIVVIMAVLMNQVFSRWGEPWLIEESHLVQVPIADAESGLMGLLQFPDFSVWADAKLYLAAVTIAIVASLETLLNLEAVDRLDPQQRTSPPNRELVAQGVGNMIAGLVGGLPMTSVIVRSSVNINTSWLERGVLPRMQARLWRPCKLKCQHLPMMEWRRMLHGNLVRAFKSAAKNDLRARGSDEVPFFAVELLWHSTEGGGAAAAGASSWRWVWGADAGFA
ncbi:MAG: SulP family inorganic anion transporter, partial [bacterium]|nr:SulP family inorganic anion transporter [bacterium]